MKKEALEKGLSKLGLTYDDYINLDNFKEKLINLEFEELICYRLMIIKTLGYLKK